MYPDNFRKAVYYGIVPPLCSTWHDNSSESYGGSRSLPSGVRHVDHHRSGTHNTRGDRQAHKVSRQHYKPSPLDDLAQDPQNFLHLPRVDPELVTGGGQNEFGLADQDNADVNLYR